MFLQVQREFLAIAESELKIADTEKLFDKATTNWEMLAIKIKKLSGIESSKNITFKDKMEAFMPNGML